MTEAQVLRRYLAAREFRAVFSTTAPQSVNGLVLVLVRRFAHHLDLVDGDTHGQTGLRLDLFKHVAFVALLLAQIECVLFKLLPLHLNLRSQGIA